MSYGVAVLGTGRIAWERGDEDTPVPQTHGLKVLKVPEATEESARRGREVVLDLE